MLNHQFKSTSKKLINLSGSSYVKTGEGNKLVKSDQQKVVPTAPLVATPTSHNLVLKTIKKGDVSYKGTSKKLVKIDENAEKKEKKKETVSFVPSRFNKHTNKFSNKKLESKNPELKLEGVSYFKPKKGNTLVLKKRNVTKSFSKYIIAFKFFPLERFLTFSSKGPRDRKYRNTIPTRSSIACSSTNLENATKESLVLSSTTKRKFPYAESSSEEIVWTPTVSCLTKSRRKSCQCALFS